MEKRLRKINFCCVLALAALCARAQTPSFEEKIRFPLWAEIDAYPELPEASNLEAGVFDFPISRLKQTAPFIIEGMVFGWEFTYVPSDRARNVEEFFELVPVQENKAYLSALSYSGPWVENGRVNVWVEFSRTPEMTRLYRLWSSINHAAILGRGRGKMAAGFDGITDAVTDAAKNAVRAHYRTKTKNKPKEITGKVLIRHEPKFGINRGEYVAQIDFFLETDRIIQYNNY